MNRTYVIKFFAFFFVEMLLATGPQATASAATEDQYYYRCNMVAEKNVQAFVAAKSINSPVDLSDDNAVVLKLLCQVNPARSSGETVVANVTVTNSLSRCSSTSSSLCWVDSEPRARSITLTPSLADTGIYVLVANPGPKMETLNHSVFSLSLEGVSSSDRIAAGDFFTFDPLELGHEKVRTTCRLSVSGASEDRDNAHCGWKDCVPSNYLTLENGKLFFQVEVNGTTGDLSIPKSIDWNASAGGGPDASGIWEAAPVQTEVKVQAKVTLKNGNVNYCSVKFKQKGVGYTIGVNKFGDCSYYRSVRNYYYLNASNSGPQVGGYPAPLTTLGFNAKYGKNAPDIPFRGVLNVAENNVTKDIDMNEGQVVYPRLSERSYSRAIVVAKKLGRDGKLGDPAYWGILNPNDYSSVRLRAVGNQLTGEDTLLVFQTFLAAKQVVDGQDVRGISADAIPYYAFTESRGGGNPYDRLIPLMNDSCTPLFQIAPPARTDKEKTAEMKDTASCSFSRPFKLGDFKSGRVSLSVLHMAPIRANHEYPLDLLKSLKQMPAASSVVVGTTATSSAKACWKLPPVNFSIKSASSYASWAVDEGSTSTTNSTTTNASSDTISERAPGDECSLSLAQSQSTSSSTQASRSGRMGIRYSSFSVGWGLKFQEQVAEKGVGKVLVEMHDPKQIQGFEFEKYLANLAFDGAYDQGAASFNGYISSAPSDKVSRKTFVVRDWGHDTGSVATWSSVFGKFEADVCPGSQFSYDNVSLSWSPLILDLKGQGIKISRKGENSRAFKIRSPASEEAFVDWPENVADVGILTLPNKKGEVTSIAELFGDDKHKNGFEKLKTLDSNKDGKIDKADAKFSELRLWMDLNRNAVAEKEELFTLPAKGVSSINVKYTRAGDTEKAEDRVLSGTYFNSQKGKLMNIEDVYFYEYKDSQRVSQKAPNE